MENPIRDVRFSLGQSLTPVVRTLIWINVLVFLFLTLVHGRQIGELFAGPLDTEGLLIRLLGLVPQSVLHSWAWWQPLTYMFVHQQFWHLLLNMLGLWWFGVEIERFMGSTSFLRYYLLTGVSGALATIVWPWTDPLMPTIGASAAIFGLLVAYGFLFPNRTIYLYLLIPIRAVYCIALYGVVTFIWLWTDRQSGTSHIAHMGGLVAGLVWFFAWRKNFHFSHLTKLWRKRKMRRHLRLIKKNSNDDDQLSSYNNKTVH